MTRPKAYWEGVEDFGRHVKLVEDLVPELGIGHMAIRRLAARRGLGTKIGRLTIFTPRDVEALRNRTDLRTREGREAVAR